MDSNTSLALTAKGVEEVKHRTCKLSIRKRSVLLLLETPHRVDHLLQKTVLQPEEFAVEIEGMIQDGFIQVAFLVITVIANMRGLTDAAAVGIVEKIISFLFLVPSSMLSTVSALGAQCIGAGKPRHSPAH